METLRQTNGLLKETHLAIKFLHGHQVKGFERVSCGSNEVQACMDAGVVVTV